MFLFNFDFSHITSYLSFRGSFLFTFFFCSIWPQECLISADETKWITSMFTPYICNLPALISHIFVLFSYFFCFVTIFPIIISVLFSSICNIIMMWKKQTMCHEVQLLTWRVCHVAAHEYIWILNNIIIFNYIIFL